MEGGREKMNTINKWTERELKVLREFIKENPTVKLQTVALPDGLRAQFPGRTNEAVYHCWRRLLGIKRKKNKNIIATEALIQAGIMRAMGSAAVAYMRQHFSKGDGPEVERLREENAELKARIREITPIIDAVERTRQERHGKAV
jgi:hypothetical protein